MQMYNGVFICPDAKVNVNANVDVNLNAANELKIYGSNGVNVNMNVIEQTGTLTFLENFAARKIDDTFCNRI